MEVKKYQDHFGNVLELSENDVTFKICFGGDLDLYWSINNLNADDEIDYETFTISKEDPVIYSLFEQLYSSIANCEVFEVSDIENALATNEEEIKSINERNIKANEEAKNSDEYKRLFDGHAITWISDENGYKKESIVKISKGEDKFVLEFARKLKDDPYNWPSENGFFAINIRFRNSGSSYQPFNQLFMKMYNALEDYEPEHDKSQTAEKTRHQI